MRINDLCGPVTSGVLMSMDVFLTGYRKAQTLADDKIALEKLAFVHQWKHRFNFTEQLFYKGNSVIVTTPQQKIVFASSNIMGLTGYQPDEIVGHTPVLFQGEKTEAHTRVSIRRLVEKQMAFDETVINYRKNGSLYKCHIKGFPIFNRSKTLVNYIAFEKEMPLVM
ncbi:MAG: PAS domain-containing protein [Sphingobacteriaceae bacterium]|nr:MAG: PAS domain-containing protein [Sphingobacteriaceae bacterium]